MLPKLIRHFLHKIPSEKFYSFFSRRINKTNFGVIVSLHSVTSNLDSTKSTFNNFIELSVANLEKNITRLKKLNARFVSLKEMEAVLAANKMPSRPIVHLSFDDGYRDNYTLAFPVLKKHRIPFSIFIVSDFMDNKRPFMWWHLAANIVEHKRPISFETYAFQITKEDYDRTNAADLFAGLRDFLLENLHKSPAYFETVIRNASEDYTDFPETLTWSELNEMIASGFCEAGIHTASHPRFKKLSEAEMENEIAVCRDAITHHTGITPQWFAYPYGGPKDLADKTVVQNVMTNSRVKFALTTVNGELNGNCNPFFLPRVFINNASTEYTLKTRLNGSYQRSVPSNL